MAKKKKRVVRNATQDRRKTPARKRLPRESSTATKKPRKPRVDEWEGETVYWEDDFLAALAEGGNVWHATVRAGISRDLAYKRRRRYKGFRARWKAALDDHVDRLAHNAVSIAIRDRSVPMTIFLLKARDPGTFRDNTMERGVDPAQIASVLHDTASAMRDTIPPVEADDEEAKA